MTAPAADSYQRYLPYRRVVEIGFWVVLCVMNAMGNTLTTLIDIRREGLDSRFQDWEPAVWEWSSNMVLLALVPFLVWFTRRFPLHFDTWRRNLPWHVLGSLAWSVMHVAAMVAIRKLAYAVQGAHYDFG